MPSLDRLVWNKFRVKRGDNVPYVGWGATRDTLAELFGEFGYTKGAEIGVLQGAFSEVLFKKIPNLELLCVDSWVRDHKRSDEAAAGNYIDAQKRLAPYRSTLIKKTSMEAVKEVPDGSLDFVYIDGLHRFEAVMLDIIHWSHKVRSGGMVSGHDYCWGYQTGVIPAVDAYTRGMGILQWYLTKEQNPSWMWIKL